MKISVVVPVYEEPELLEDIISKVVSYDYPGKEIVVVVDGWSNEKIENVLSKFEGLTFLRVIYNGVRKGKVESLNAAVELCSGEGIFFVDNDVELPEDKDFLRKLARELDRNDIVEVPKEGICSSLFSKIVSYDYLGGAIASFLSSRILGKNLFLCGSAFAIRKDTFLELGKFPKVINEDWMLMLKTFGTGKRFSYPTDLKVRTAVPSNLVEWINQRKRWSIGMRLWWFEVFGKISLYVRSLKALVAIGVVMSTPIVVSSVVFILMSNCDAGVKVLNFVFLVAHYFGLSSNLSVVGYFLTLLLVGVKGIASFVTMFVTNALIFFVFSRFLKFRFNVLEFFVYSNVYYPFLVGFYVFYGWFSLLCKPKLDWVVDTRQGI